MNIDVAAFFRSPKTHASLNLKTSNSENETVSEKFLSEDGEVYPIIDGIPDFTIYSEHEKNKYAIHLFKEKAKEYDKYQHLSFETFYEDETTVRNTIIDRLELKPNSKVLEINAGTGRDSVLIARRLSEEGLLHVQDISREMLEFCREKLAKVKVQNVIHQGNASQLPYADKSFDAVYSFGGVGMNTYSNNKEALREMVRVTRTNGKIVVGGLSLAPWLKNTFFGKVLTNHNNHYGNEIRFNDFPIEARNLKIEWILGGAGFAIDFVVGDGEPKANFEYEIPGPRGGTHLTRYLGGLEGVTPETKKMAIQAREKLGISMHKWLDELIKQEAKKILNR